VAIFGAVTVSALSYLVAGGDLDTDGVAAELTALFVDGLRPSTRGG
jgi:hypothetical protein